MANQRGRRPASHLSIASVTTLEIIKRPAPPAGMPVAEAIIWRVVVDSMAADWFRPEQLPLLEQYYRHKVASDDIAGMIFDLRRPSVDEDGAKAFQVFAVTYGELLKMQERETRTIAMLATKMRLAQQSTYDKSKRKPTVGPRPWQE